MKIKLGIVGPKDSVHRMTEVIDTLENHFIVLPFVYEYIEETEEIVKKHDIEVDVWIFSGQAPFSIAMNTDIKHKAYFPSLNGTSLMKTLFEITYHQNYILKHLSIDTLTKAEIHETFNDLNLPTTNVVNFSYNGYRSTKQLIDFHYKAYQANNNSIAITCIHAVYKQLKDLTVPVYRVTPTNLALRQVIDKSYQQSEIRYFKSAQIVNITLQIHDLEQRIEVERNYHLDLKVQEIIIKFAEEIFGSFIRLTNEKYMLFTTRGPLEEYGRQSTTLLLEKISMLTNLYTTMGIGCGKTSIEAEKHAYLAFREANNAKENCAMILDEREEIRGPFNILKDISTKEQKVDKELEMKLNKAGVAVPTFHKIIQVQNNLSLQAVTSADIAEWLQMTQRNARRILTSLEKHDLAKVIEQETVAQRGRPKKLFHVYVKI